MAYDELMKVLEDYKRQMAEVFSSKLEQIILFGSYARGENKKDSDVDLMLLLNVPQEEISGCANIIYDMTYDVEKQYGIEINPCVQSGETFRKWQKVYPFFMNIQKEGVKV